MTKTVLAVAAAAGMLYATHAPFVKLHPGYRVVNIRPESFQPMVTGLEVLPNGELLVLTWRGHHDPRGEEGGVAIVPSYQQYGEGACLYRVSNLGGDRTAIKVTKVATRFSDPMGLAVVGGSVYVGDIDRIFKLIDADGDGVYENRQEIAKVPSYRGWFAYSFGLVHKDGYFYMALAAGVKANGTPERQLGADRSTVIRVPVAGGAYEVVAEGFRAPDGIGLGPDREIFVTDNQGSWRPSSQLIHVEKGKFYGYKVEPKGPMQMAAGTRVDPPVLWMPHGEANDSPTEPHLMAAGPFAGQLIYGDISLGGLYRAFLEKVNGRYQGAVFLLTGGMESAAHRLRTGSRGEIWFGGVGRPNHDNTGWNSKVFGLQKLEPTGTIAFEMLAVRSRAKGMEIEFTKELADDAVTPARYAVQQWNYNPTATYGGPKQNTTPVAVKSAQLSPDRKSVFLEMDGLKTGYVIGITLVGLKSKGGESPWYAKTWYTLGSVSPSAPFEISTAARAPQPLAGLRLRRLAGDLAVDLPAGAFRVELLTLRGGRLEVREAASGTLRLAKAGRAGLHVLRIEGEGLRQVLPVVF